MLTQTELTDFLPELRRTARKYAAPADREDLVQDAMVELWRCRERIDGLPLMRAIVSRLFKNTRKRQPQVKFAKVEAIDRERSEAPRAENIVFLREMVKSVPKARLLAELAANDNHAEVAARLGIPLITLGTRCFRFREQMRRAA